MKQLEGVRKLIAYALAMVIYASIVIIALLKGATVPDGSAFVSSLTEGFAGITGLFYGANLIEHLSKKPWKVFSLPDEKPATDEKQGEEK